MKKILVFAFALILFVPYISQAETSHLVISQIQITGGPGLTANDFIEIYNPTAADIDIKDWKLRKTTSSGTETSLVTFSVSDTTTIVPAHGFYLWANSNFAAIATAPDSTRSATIADNNSVSLVDNSGLVIDSFSWGEGPAESTGPYGYARTDNSGEFLLVTSLSPRNSQSEIDPPLIDEEPVLDPEPVPEPPAPPVSSGGSVAPAYSSAVKISEFMPNPEGVDGGAEWVELFSPIDADLSGWKLDDEGADGTAGSSAFVFPAGSKILANQYLAVTIPKGKFALNNTGGDTLRLIWPSNQTLEGVSYTESAPEGVSFGRLSTGLFAWAENLVEEEEAEETEIPESLVEPETISYPDEILISELFPYPPKGTDEFIELQNTSSETVNLKNWILADKATKYKISDTTLPAGGFLILHKSQTKIALNNFGEEEVVLMNPNGEIGDRLAYADSPKNQSYNRIEGEDSLWSLAVTPGRANSVKTQIQTAAVEDLAVIEPADGAGQVAAATLDAPEVPAEIRIYPAKPSLWQRLLWPALSFVWGIIICYSYFTFKQHKTHEQTRID